MQPMKLVTVLVFVLQLVFLDASITPSLRTELERFLDTPRRQLQSTVLDIILKSYASSKTECLHQLAQDCEELKDGASDPCSEESAALFFKNVRKPSEGRCHMHFQGSFNAGNVNNLFGLDQHPEVYSVSNNERYQVAGSGIQCSSQYLANHHGLKRGLGKISGGSWTRFQHDPNAGEGVTIYMMDTGLCSGCPSRDTFSGKVLSQHNVLGASGYKDLTGHGTHVAGILVGEKYGVARGAKLVSVRVYDGFDAAGDPIGTKWTFEQGLNWIESQCDQSSDRCVINSSNGAPANDAHDDEWDLVADQGIPIVVAAGNDGIDAVNVSPARASYTINVGNAKWNQGLGRYERVTNSNYGDTVDIWAPGYDILSEGLVEGVGVEKGGTSMAAPFVAGVVAAIVSRLDRKMSKTEVMEELNRVALQNVVQDARSVNKNFLQFLCVQDGEAKDPGVNSRGPFYGGNGGSYFQDKCPEGEYVKAVAVRAGSLVDSISIRCTNEAWRNWHGGNGGGYAHKYAGYDRFCGATVRSGSLVDRICLIDNRGVQWCQGGSGGTYRGNSENFCASEDERKVLVGIRGRSGSLVDKIQFLWKKIECPEFYTLRDFNTGSNVDYTYKLQYYRNGFPYYKSTKNEGKAMWTYTSGTSTNFLVGRDTSKFKNRGHVSSRWKEGRTCPSSNNGHLKNYANGSWRSVSQSTGEIQVSAAVIHGRLLRAFEADEVEADNDDPEAEEDWHTQESAPNSKSAEGCHFFDSEDECQANDCLFFNKEGDHHEDGERLFLCWEKTDCNFSDDNVLLECH